MKSDFLLSSTNAEPPSQTNIILLGMSGIGKSFWAGTFASFYDLTVIELDVLIANSPVLEKEISGISGASQVEKMGKYFGMPWEEGFQQKENIYLKIERERMRECANIKNAVLDLSGSAVLHPQEMADISKTGIVVYLEADEDTQDLMLKNYIKNPKPVCWNHGFNQEDTESPSSALEQCYKQLLKDRTVLYEKYADVTVPFSLHRNGKTVEEILNLRDAILKGWHFN